MTNRELDAWIAEKVMGKDHFYTITSWVPHYTEDRNDAALVLEKVGELGKVATFLKHLHSILEPDADHIKLLHFPWKVLMATPRQLMDAVKECVEGVEI